MALTVRITEEEFERRFFTERAEYVDGEVVMLPAAESRKSENLRWFLGDLLRFAARKAGGEVYGPNLTVRLRPGLRRLPDLIWVSPEHVPGLDDTGLTGPPDLAVEIVSQDSVPRDWREKFLEYEAYGVTEYLVVDPLSQRVELYRRQASGRFEPVEVREGWLESAVVEGFRFRPQWLWPALLPDLVEALQEAGLL